MSVINRTIEPANGADVFSPMVFEYAFAQSSCQFVDLTGIAAIDVANGYDTIIQVGDNIRILNGAYLGVYQVTQKIPDALLRLVLNTPFIGTSGSTGSTSFVPDGTQDFQLLAGYSDGAESTLKPWQVIDEIRVSSNQQGVYRFDVSGFLKSRFSITPPVEGANVPISLRYDVRLKSATAIPTDTNAKTAYYGLEDLSIPQQEGNEPVGDRPILFFGNAPTVYSLALGKGIIHNFIANPADTSLTTSGSVVSLQLLSCQPKEVTWIGSQVPSALTITPALPSWISATVEGNNVKIVINPCTAGAGDYLANDYNPLDYLVGGQINSITGCFSHEFDLGYTSFDLNVCVSPISEIVEVCLKDTLNFAWLNERGGFSSLAVECKYTDGRSFGGDYLTVDGNQNLKRTEFTDVYNYTEVTGGVINKNQINLLASLRSAIQAFLFNTQTNAFDIPIVIDRANFTTYGNRFNQSEVRFAFRFRKSKQVTIQTQ
jgi:hypothetical protein